MYFLFLTAINHRDIRNFLDRFFFSLVYLFVSYSLAWPLAHYVVKDNLELLIFHLPGARTLGTLPQVVDVELDGD